MVNVNISLIDETINSISKCNPNQPKFNPYEQNITSMGDTNAKTYEGESSMIYN